MIQKVVINDLIQRQALAAILATSGYVVWVEEQVGRKHLLFPDHVVCFCEKSAVSVKTH